MDTTPDFGGDGSATKPLELLLLALGGCTGMDVVSMLNKMRVSFTAFELNLLADRAEDHPRVYTRIKLEYVITSRDADEVKVKRAIDLSREKYCSVSAMLSKACPIEHSLRIIRD